MARTPIIIGNWKLHKTIKEGQALATEIKNQTAAIRGVNIGIAPTHTALFAIAGRCEDSHLMVCAQNCYTEEQGAFTGEISPGMVKDTGATGVILGHSERRSLFGDSNDVVGRKVAAALGAGLSPVVCIGESEQERKNNITFDVLKNQCQSALAHVKDADSTKLVLAYEPVWAIGTGLTATPEQAQEVHLFVRGLLKDRFDPKVADGIRIQYGGSVKPGNAAELLAQPDIDGALVGGASLKSEDFVAICRAAAA